MIGVLQSSSALATAGVRPAGPGISTTTITVGNGPVGVAVDTASHTAYVANENSNTVSVLNERTFRVTATIEVGSAPSALAVDSNTHTVYVANSGDGTVSVISEHTNKVIRVIDVRIHGNVDDPDGVVIDTPAHTVFIGQYAGYVTSINDQTNKPRVFYHNKIGHTTMGAVDQFTGILFAGAQDNRAVQEISVRSGKLIGSLGGLGLPNMAAEDNASPMFPGYLFVGTFGSNPGVAVYNDIKLNNLAPPPGRIWNFIHTPANPDAVTVNPNTNMLFAAIPAPDGGPGTVEIIIRANGESPARSALVTVGTDPQAITVDPAEGTRGTVLVTNHDSNTVTAFAG